MDAYERFECWGSLGNHLGTGRSLDQSSRGKQIIEEQRKKMKGRAHLGTIELVNEGTIKTTSFITGMIGCHIMKGLLTVISKKKRKNQGHARNEAILLLLKLKCRSSIDKDGQ